MSQDQCWKTIMHPMRESAEAAELAGQPNHGMGDLDEPCKGAAGEICPACGKQFD